MKAYLVGLCVTLCLVPSVTIAHEINPAVIEYLTGETITYDHHHDEVTTEADPRGASRRLYTIPEWLIVYTAIEYGQFVQAGGDPSAFPYFTSTKQLWSAWNSATDILGEEPDPTTNTVLYTIAISTTIEQGILGIYEGTIGWLFEWLDGGLVTPEDRYTNQVAAEYGAFLLHTPWYAFPYGQKLIGLWQTWGFASFTPRGLERRLAFTIGYGAKALYAGAIRLASASQFEGGAGLATDVMVTGTAEQLTSLRATYEGLSTSTSDSLTVVLPRYRAFTPALTQLFIDETSVVAIMGHDVIALSSIVSSDTSCPEVEGYRVMTLPLLTDETRVRAIYDVPVADLEDVFGNLSACGYEVEHVYDF